MLLWKSFKFYGNLALTSNKQFMTVSDSDAEVTQVLKMKLEITLLPRATDEN
jgi:hypothetical protein